MPRYFTKPKAAKAFWVEDEHYGQGTNITNVSVCDHEATCTGIMDAEGDYIWRAPPPMGFQFWD